jgi:hypothetical protein
MYTDLLIALAHPYNLGLGIFILKYPKKGEKRGMDGSKPN